jgi:hypothetical protein
VPTDRSSSLTKRSSSSSGAAQSKLPSAYASSEVIRQLVDGVARGSPRRRKTNVSTAEDQRQARGVLLRLLSHESDGRLATALVGGLVQLDPTVSDLGIWRSWAVRPTVELIAAARRNSALAAWTAALPSLV